MKIQGKRWLLFFAISLILLTVVCLLISAPFLPGGLLPPAQIAGTQHATISATTATPTATPISMSLVAHPTMTPAPTKIAGSDDGPAHWTLIYSDDFNGTQLSSTWGKYGGPHTGGQSYYDPNEVQVQNGLLLISMERKTEGGLPYATGGLAAFRLAQVYGKYEFRIKLPHGKGVGPYAILWPNQLAANTAQVDIFESPPANKGTIYFTNHGVDGTSSQVTANGNFADDFHMITCEWMPGTLRLLVDGVVEGTLTHSIFTQPMWFGLAISSGDAFTGLPDNTTTLPVTMRVDWVHIYKYNP